MTTESAPGPAAPKPPLPRSPAALSAGELSVRAAEIRALGRDGLESIERGERHALLRFRADADIFRRVSEIAEAERECCPFLSIEVEQRGDAVLLRIAAPDGGEETVSALAALFEPAATAG